MLPLLQQAARQAAASTDAGTLLWAGILQEEVRAVQDDPRRVPFAGSLPAQAGAGLEPFRQRLEQTFSVAVNDDRWEGEFEKAWHLAFTPDNRLTALVRIDDEWTVVTKDHKNSAHFEHTIAVVAGGCEVLTRREGVATD
mgnify:CR=1 FL=1